MSEPAASRSDDAQRPIVVQTTPSRSRTWVVRILVALLVVSVMFNLGLYSAYQAYYGSGAGPMERYHSGSRTADDKIAVVEVSGTIMPPYTGRILQMIEKARDDDAVKGIVLAVDSPGGLVADSHQIYHALVELRQETQKPVVVAMQRMAASGGYYVSMGAGPDARIFAEPTTWTGSIGVIIPHYDVSGLADKVGVESQPLKTGPLKDSLSPFRPLTERDKEVWGGIMNDAFDRFVGIIAENRPDLTEDDVRELATGQVYTAEQAVDNGLVDEIGFQDDAVAELEKQLGLEDTLVVEYQFQPNLVDLLTGNMQAAQPKHQWREWMETTVPRAMYYCSWSPFAGSW